jgi:Ca2+-binding RTX toxin-like protein
LMERLSNWRIDRFTDWYVTPNIGVKDHSAPGVSVRPKIAARGIHKGDAMFRRIFGIAGLFGVLGVLGIGAGSASAQTGNPFGCTAGTANAMLGSTDLLPGATVANAPDTPCATDTATLSAVPLDVAGGLNLGTIGPAHATTTLSTATVAGSTVYTGATSTSTVDALNLNLAGNTIGVTTPSTATVSYQCVNDLLQPSYSSSLTAITINGNTVPVADITQDLPAALQGIVQITPNLHTSTATSDSETLLHIQVLGAAPGGAVTIDAGTATASVTQSEGCAGTSSGSGSGSGGGSGSGSGGGNGGNGGNGGGGSGAGGCPAGSTAVSGGNLCEIAAGSEGNSSAITFNSGDISGGTVYSLAYAKKHFKSLCLDGAGPNYAVIGTKANNTITVSGTRQRVLGLGGKDKITVKSGAKTCVDGGSGNDTIKAGKAAVKVYGGAGNDKITAGNGTDVVYGDGGQDVIKAGNGKDSLNGGAGNDTITAGNGADHLYGNAGADKLTAGTGRDYLFGAAGNDIMRARGAVAFVNGGKGHNVAYVQQPMASFARKHGTKTVHII